MRILFLGDIIGRAGREAAVAALPGLRAALFEVGRAIARRSTETPNAYN